MPAALDRDVFHRQRARAAVLHRAVLATRLRELYARRRHAADAARDLDRAGLSRFPQGAQIQCAAGSLRQLRLALEPVANFADNTISHSSYAGLTRVSMLRCRVDNLTVARSKRSVGMDCRGKPGNAGVEKIATGTPPTPAKQSVPAVLPA